jgi:regulator of sigma E protease
MGIITAILVLGVLVFVHELGHFLVAKFFGVGVLEFALGFGPVLLRWRGRETTYCLRAIPLGGFVRMAGEDPALVYGSEIKDGSSGDSNTSAGGGSLIEGTQEDLSPEQQRMASDKERWFLNKPYLPRVAIVLAGPVANFLFAWTLAFVGFAVVGLPTLVDGPVTIGAIQKDMPAERAGLKSGDRVISVDGRSVNSFKELVDSVRASGGRSLQFLIERQKGAGESAQGVGGATVTIEREVLTVPVQPLSDASPELDVLEGRPVHQTYRIGVTPGVANMVHTKVGIALAAEAAVSQVVELSLQTLRVLRGLLTGLLSPRKTIGGPIEIIKQTAASADEGVMAIVGIMIFLNVTLGIMNLLPIPVLDGGQITMFTIEKLMGKPLSMRIKAAATNVGLVLLLSLMVFAIGNDLLRAFL